ncbi:MAG: hypothetical protein LBT92_00955 [Rickettsiales bacterium]|jgi:hypothetical protein|nr:hypothetical protein [Rickettsiales bacterium]
MSKKYLIVFCGLFLIIAGVAIRFLTRNSAKPDVAIVPAVVPSAPEKVAGKGTQISAVTADKVLSIKVSAPKYKTTLGVHYAYEGEAAAPKPRPKAKDKLDGTRISCAGLDCGRPRSPKAEARLEANVRAKAKARDSARAARSASLKAAKKSATPTPSATRASSGVSVSVAKGKAASAARPVLPSQICGNCKWKKGSVVITKNTVGELKCSGVILGDLYIANIDGLKLPEKMVVMGSVYVYNSVRLSFGPKSYVRGNIFVRGRSSIKTLSKGTLLGGQIFV